MSDLDAAGWAPLPRRPGPEPGAAELEALLAWARGRGVVLGPIEVRIDARGERNVYATREVAPDEVLVAVPRASIVAEADATAAAPYAGLGERGVELHSRQSPMAMWLAREVARTASPWQPFFAAMPRGFERMPVFRPAADLAGLNGTRALDAIIAKASGIHDDRTALIAAEPALADVALTEFAWARSALGSRSFRLDDDPGLARALVPIADLFAHGPIRAHWSYDAEAATFLVRAAEPIAAGDEITITYGAHPNAVMVASYGFAVPDNLEDEVGLELDSLRGSEWIIVGAMFDERLQQAQVLASAVDDDGDGPGWARVAAAALARCAAIGAAPAPTPADPAWRAVIHTVRAGERAALEAIAGAADELALVCDRPDADWRVWADHLNPEFGGAARIFHGYATHRLRAAAP